MTRKDVTPALNFAHPVLRASKTLLSGRQFFLFQLKIDETDSLYARCTSLESGWRRLEFFHCFRSYSQKRGWEGQERESVFGFVWQSRSYSACLPIIAASTGWRLAGSKYFNPRSRGSVTQWRHVLMGLVGLYHGGIHSERHSEDEVSSQCVPTHVFRQDVPGETCTSRGNRGSITFT